MADLSSLLEERADELVEVNLPEGTWKMLAVSAKLTEPKFSEKMGMDFRQARFVLKPVSPNGDVDPNEVKDFEAADGYNEATVFFNYGPIARKSDLVRLRRLLEAAGISPTGLTIPEMLEEINGDQHFYVEVAHVQTEEGLRVRGEKIYAVLDEDDD